jgi:hypothetical protein
MSEEVEIYVKTKIIVRIPEFDENDRTDLVIGIGENYGINGSIIRTDLGRWYFYIDSKPPISFNIFLEDNGSLYTGSGIEEDKVEITPIINRLKGIARKIYDDLMKNKYQPLFDKYVIKDWQDLRKKNYNLRLVENWLNQRWIKGDIHNVGETGLQNGNLGMNVHTWQNINVQKPFRARIDYYIDFPGKIFKPNLYGGSQSSEEILKWGKKSTSINTYYFNNELDRNTWIKEALDRFKTGELMGFEKVVEELRYT